MENISITLADLKNLIYISTMVVWHEQAAYISIYGNTSQLFNVYGDANSALPALEAVKATYDNQWHDNTSVEAWLNYLCVAKIIPVGVYTVTISETD